MNVLAYSMQDPQKVGAKVEEKLREELGASAPIPFTVEEGSGAGVTVRNFLAGAARVLVGGKGDLMYTLIFDIPAPRPAQLRAHVNRQGVGALVGALLFSTRLQKPVSAEVTLGEKRFEGDPTGAAKLNAQRDLVKRVLKFARTKTNVAGLDVTVPRLGQIVPGDDGGSHLVVGTLGRAHALGFKMSIDAKEFFEIAAAIEEAL